MQSLFRAFQGRSQGLISAFGAQTAGAAEGEKKSPRMVGFFVDSSHMRNYSVFPYRGPSSVHI